MLGPGCCSGFSLVAASRFYPLVEVPGLLTAAASPFVERGLQGTLAAVVTAWGLLGSSTGLVIVVQGLTCLAACGIFQDEGLNPCLLRWQLDSL